MKKYINFYIKVFMFLSIHILVAQVGIGTNNPKGLLDVTSSIHGIVYPSVILTSTQVAAPVINPATGDNVLVDGTTVYNTNATTNGINDVEPGIYSWDATNTEWVTHFFIRQVELFEQSGTLRSEAILGFQDVPGLGISSSNSFTAKYSGLYRIELKVNHGGGRVNDNDAVNAVMTEGDFRFNWDGANNDFSVKAISSFNQSIGSGTNYENIWAETFKVIYVNLTAQQTYNFYLQFDAFADVNLIGSGSTGGGGAPTAVNLVNENFEGSMIGQTFVPDVQCSPAGWSINTTNPCTSCTSRHLYISGAPNNCTQNATAFIPFTPTLSTVNISFDYKFLEVNNKNDSFRVYIQNGAIQTNLVNINNAGNATTNTSYSASSTVIPGTAYTIRFEYINGTKQAGHVSVDNVVISELSGISPPSTEGRGYVGADIPCYIEISYIDEN